MDVDRFFLETLDELEIRIQQDASEYDLLRAAGILRELLIDGSRLVDQVNRASRLPLRFRVRVKTRDPGHEFEMWLGLGPDDKVDIPIREVDLQELLKVPVVFMPSTTVTVRQLITLASNVRGGVHRGRSRDPVHAAFERFRPLLRHGDMPMELLLVVKIGRVALAGLEPLRQEVRSRMPPPTARVPRVARVTIEP